MLNALVLSKRTANIVLAAVLAASALIPILLSANASAFAQMTERQITMDTSEAAATDVVYTVTFKPATTGVIRGIIIDFCDGPIVGTACTTVGGVAGINTNETTIGVYNESGAGFSTGWAVDTGESSTTKLVLEDAAGTSVTAGTAISFDLGNGTSGDGIDNPSGTGSFYARILTVAAVADDDSYDSTITGATNPPAATVDAGGVALSTADQLTINARVQEVLQFCVGTLDAASANDCTDISETVVDIGVVQAGSVSISPVSAVQGGNNRNGLAMIRTNAVNGATIVYFAEPVTGDAGSGFMSSLRVSGAACPTGTGLLGSNSTEQCFNSAGTTQTVFGASEEGFGMTVSSVDTSNGTTTNVTRDAEYNGDGTNGGGQGWAWSEGVTDTIATSTTVIDDEMLILRFAAQAAVTTPTGSYGVTSTYVATSKF
jgi:hypothetical protein